ncbi:MAG: hypothetical protein KatS3mg060_0352 [Dehalococcoidia bacterium]|nr:MAG: hypothetical protein KatS3mg060_0352 [Dehalococcoidia bacterium]
MIDSVGVAVAGISVVGDDVSETAGPRTFADGAESAIGEAVREQLGVTVPRSSCGRGRQVQCVRGEGSLADKRCGGVRTRRA